jgi:hypothetical protein
MTERTYNVVKPDNGVPIKAWTKGVREVVEHWNVPSSGLSQSSSTSARWS